MNKSTALEYFGAPSKLADALQINVGAVYMWKSLIPEHYARRLPSLTGGALKFDQSIYDAARELRHKMLREFGAMGGRPPKKSKRRGGKPASKTTRKARK